MSVSSFKNYWGGGGRPDHNPLLFCKTVSTVRENSLTDQRFPFAGYEVISHDLETHSAKIARKTAVQRTSNILFVTTVYNNGGGLAHRFDSVSYGY